MAGELTFSPVINPVFDIDDAHAPKLLVAEFGDGYAQRARNGMNHDPSALDLRWDNISVAEGAVIWAFLKARGGDEAFFYDPPFLETGKKWTCPTYKRSFTDPDTMNIVVSFKECFDP